jgi:hypothetical protein
MPVQVCPRCTASTPRLVQALSEVASVFYYRCPQCSHIWTVQKDDPARIEHITELPTGDTQKS